MKKKNCIFCNQEVVNKTKEHIIPQWLIKKTGKLNRQINMGISTEFLYNEDFVLDEKKIIRKFSFKDLTFPACEDCNNRFSKLESEMQKVLDKLEQELPLFYDEIESMLDWFDKVRVGFWYGNYYLNKVNIVPRFGIEDRMGSSDRILMIIKNNSLPKGINFVGNNAPSFDKNPVSFGLRINDLWFLNISATNFISEDLGYDFIKMKKSGKETEENLGELIEGSGRILMNSILEKLPTVFDKGLVFMQPILSVVSLDGKIIKRAEQPIFHLGQMNMVNKVNRDLTLTYKIPNLPMNPLYFYKKAVEIQELDLKKTKESVIVDEQKIVEIDLMLEVNQKFFEMYSSNYFNI